MNLFTSKRKDAHPPSLGVDLGSGNAKLVHLDMAGSRVEVKAASTHVLSPDAVEGGVIREPRKFGKKLAQWMEQSGIGPSVAVVSVPSNLAVLRWLNLPLLVGSELRQAAQFKVKRHLPFPVESAYVEASIPEIADGESTGQSLVIAVPRAVIDSRAEALEAAGLRSYGAELEGQAILRVVERRLNQESALWRDASLTIIDVGANNTHMYVVQNQRLQFIRGVKFGTQRIAEAVANELKVSLAEGEALLSQADTQVWSEGLVKVRQGDVYKFVYVIAELEKLTREFLRLMRYFRSLHPERSYAGILDHVLLCGGLAGLHGFSEYLEDVLGLRVERARPFGGVVGTFTKQTFETIANRQESYTVAMGLALSGIRRQNQEEETQNVRREYGWTRAA
ncbi:MAG: type IV pilus assembly protein PilM [Fimbriimonadaceae bacterium]